jgi:hemolysin activation/secretion protein
MATARPLAGMPARLGRTGRALALAAVAAMMPAGTVRAQGVVERHLPPEPPHRAPIQVGSEELYRTKDATPLGVDLRGIVLIGAKAKVDKRRAAAGIDVEGIEGVDAKTMRERLQGFLGKPLSRRLIADAQAAIAAVYREAGRPFVSVTLPAQEVTTGVLQLRVILFKLGAVSIKGAPPQDYPPDRIRLDPGQPVDAHRLETDLDWANRNPFRQVEAVFGPGKDLAQTDLIVQETRLRPVQAYLGYANSGTQSTDRDRVFVGGSAAPLQALWPAPLGDVFASWQVTGSKDFWVAEDRPFGSPGSARYFSPAARLWLPLAWRAGLELTANYVQTNETPLDPFRVRTRTGEVRAIAHVSASELVPLAFGDVLAGIELKRQQRTTFFTGIDVGNGQVDIGQWVIGWAGHWTDAFGTNSLDVQVKSNPGGVLAHNTAADWATFTNGRVTDVRSTFAVLSYSRVTALPLELSLRTDVSSLIAGTSLPDTERQGLGGNDLVRGYVTEDATVDQGVVVRNSLYLPSTGVAQRIGAPFADALAPFLLADMGWGRDLSAHREFLLASVGAGVDYQVAPAFRSNLTAACALTGALFTNAGACRILARAVVTY